MNTNYYNKFINFFKEQNLYNEEMFTYFRNNSILFDYRDEDYHPFIGCFYLTKDNKVTKISLVVPYLNSEVSTLINIHEYTHAIILYKHLNKTYIEDNTTEILPMFYERLYYEENKENIQLQKHLDLLNQKVNTFTITNVTKYKLGLDIQNELLKYYNDGHKDITTLSTKAKTLVRELTP